MILLGPPGAGKGTQGALLAHRSGRTRVATGDLLRAAVKAGTPLGTKAQRYMDQGLLVPDEVIIGLIGEVLDDPNHRDGIIMDGFPRTVAQADAVAQALEARGAEVGRVVNIVVPEPELVTRLESRAKKESRSDDTPEAIRRRLGVYQRETAPLMAYYRDRGKLAEVDGVGTVDQIAGRIDLALER